MSKASAKNNKTRSKDASARVASTPDAGKSSGVERDDAAESTHRAKGKAGVPGSKNDSRRCTATANRTGERCRAPAILGGFVCRMHGGALPAVRKAARDRLAELVDPALHALASILADPDTDDAVKVRASLGILDRAGFRPGVVVEVSSGDDKWSQMLDGGAAMVDDRSLGGGDYRGAIESAKRQMSLDMQTDLWREYEDADAEESEARPVYRDENTIAGTVVVSLHDPESDQ